MKDDGSDLDRLERLYVECRHHSSPVEAIATRLGWTEERVRDRLSEFSFGGWGRTCLTDRGEIVRSSLEREVADFLYDEGIDYEYEPEFYGPFRPDFVLRESAIAVEVWGVTGDDDYLHQRALKERWYAHVGPPLVSIEPEDIRRLDGIFPIESRDSDAVNYARAGQTTLAGLSRLLSDPSRDDPPVTKETIERGIENEARQLLLDGRPEQATIPDYREDGEPWWEAYPEPFRSSEDRTEESRQNGSC